MFCETCRGAMTAGYHYCASCQAGADLLNRVAIQRLQKENDFLKEELCKYKSPKQD